MRPSKQKHQHDALKGPAPADISESQLSAGFLDNIADGCIALDRDFHCTCLNKAAAAFLKTTPDKMVGRVLWDALPGLRDSRFREEFTRAAKGNAFVKVEDFYEPLGRWCEWRCHPTEEGFVVLFHDATDHKKVEEAMLESRQALEMAIEGSSAGIWRIDLTPQKPGHMPDYVYLSPQLKALIGFNNEFPNSRSAWFERIVPEDRSKLEEAARAHAEGRTDTYQVDFRIRHKDGGIRWFSSRGRLYRDEFNRPLRWAGVDTDITDRKLAAKVLAENEERLRQALEAGQVFTFEWRPATDEVLRSPNSASILGWTGDATHDTGQDFFKRIHPEDREAFMHLVSTLTPGRPSYETTYRYLRPDDRREVVLEESGRAVFDEAGTMICLQGLTRDITERRLAEETMRRLKEQAERAAEQARWLARFPEENPNPTLRISHEHVMLYSNRAAEGLCGYWGCWVGQKVPPVVQKIISDVLATELVTNHEILCADRTFWLTVAPCPSEHYVDIFVRDVTERKRMAESLRQTNEQLQLQTEELRSANEELQSQEEELRAQTEELEVQTEELRDNEQALREAHQRAAWLARFPEENPNPVLRVAFDGGVLYRNRACTELPGWACEVGEPLPQAALRHVVGKARTENRTIEQDIELDGTHYAVSVAPIPVECYANVYGRDITTRKRAEESLHQAHERLEMAQRAAGAGIWDWDVVTENIEWSPQMFELFGIDPTTAAASFAAWESALHPDDREAAAARIQNALTNHTDLDNEYRIVRPDGQVRWINALGRGTYDESGRALRMIGICTDITERKRSDEERETAAAFLRLVNESRTKEDLIHGAVAFFQKRSGCEAVGIRIKQGDDFPYFETHGFSEEFVLLESQLCLRDAAGCPVRDSAGYPIVECMCGNIIRGRFDPSKPFFTAHGSFWTNGTTELLATSTEADRQARTRNRCNGEGYESVALIPLNVGQERLGLLQLNDKRKNRFTPESIALWERLAGYLAVGLARAIAEEALRNANDRIEAHIGNSPLAIVEFDSDYRVNRWSGAAERVFGWKAEEIVGRAMTEMPWVHEDDAASVAQISEDMAAGRRPRNLSVNRNYRKDGSIVVCEWYNSAVYDEQGRLTSVFSQVLDITERKKTERKILRQTTILRAINRIFHEAISTSTDEGLGRVCLAVAEEITRSKFGFIGEISARGLEEIAISDPGWDACRMTDLSGHNAPLGVFPIRGVYGSVIKEGRSVLTNDPAHHPDSVGVPEGHPPLTAFLGVPLTHDGKIVGMMAVGNREGGYSPEEVETLEALAPAVVEAFLRKRAEQALAASEKEYRELIETANSVIVRWDKEGIIRFINERGASLLGYEPKELIGRHTTTLVPEVESTGRSLSSLAQDILDHPEQHEYNPNENIRKDGTRLWIAWTNKAIIDEEGNVREVLAVGNDITQLKRAEALLAESEQRYRIMGESVDYGVWAADAEGRAIYISPSFCKMVGRTFEEIREFGWLDTLAPGQKDEVVDLWMHSVRTGAPFEHEHHFIDKEGNVRVVLARGRPIRDEEGRIVSWAGINLDISERKQIEQELRESEQRLRMALETGQMGLWEWDVESDDCVWDQRVCELLGLDASAKASHSRFLQHVDPRDAPAFEEQIRKSLTEGVTCEAEFRLVRHNGEILWVTTCGRTIQDAAGKPKRRLGILYDITQRKQMEDKLRQLNDQLGAEIQAQTGELRDTIDRLQDEVVRRVLAEGRLRRQGQMLEGFFQHTITPLAFMDRDFTFVQVNEAYAQADGKTPEFFKGKNHFDLYPNDENKAIFKQVVRTGKPYRAIAKPFTYPDRPQEVTYWDWLLTPLRNERGEVQYLVLNLQDVTRQQMAMNEVEHRARLLQKLTLELAQAEDRERRRMAEVLHDGLQQQLAAAKFHLGLLSTRARNDAAMLEIAAQLDSMLREAIEQSRSLSHELSPAVLYQSDLGETFEWLARQVQTKHGLTVHIEVHGLVDSQSESIKTFLFRTGQEILFNAVKHAKVREARLRLQRKRDCLWLTIADQGNGFDPETLGQSAGFGLLSIRERVGLLGGRMRIRSAPGRGSTFLITVPDAQVVEDRRPRTEDRGRKTERVTQRRPPSSGTRPSILRVLLVDDHKVMREGLAALIAEQEDMEIVGQAGDGDGAIQQARALQPDVIIMDVAMPVMPGDEATRQIKAEMPHVRIVALSMFTEPGVREKMLDAGAEDYLAKTGPSEELLAAIRGGGR